MSGIVFAGIGVSDRRTIFLVYEDTCQWKLLLLCCVVCLSTACEREKCLSTAHERANKGGDMLQSFSSPSTCSFYSSHQVQAK